MLPVLFSQQVAAGENSCPWNNFSTTLAKLIEERLDGCDPANTVAFLVRVASMAPGIYDMSTLLGDMHVRKVHVPTILFYPGSLEGTTNLRFMDLKEREALGHYLVKIYG